MKKIDFQNLEIQDLDIIVDIALECLQEGMIYEESRPITPSSKSRRANVTETFTRSDKLKQFCSNSEYWELLYSRQNIFLIYKDIHNACVFTIRNLSKIDLKREVSLSNRSGNRDFFIANDVIEYLRNPYNKKLKDCLSNYTTNQITFFHFIWGENEDKIDIGVKYTEDNINNDWYLLLNNDRLDIQNSEDTIYPVDNVSIQDIDDASEAKIVKSKRSRDAQKRKV